MAASMSLSTAYLSRKCHSHSNNKFPRKFEFATKVLFQKTQFKRCVDVRASNPQPEQEEKSQESFISQEDVSYLWKVGAGSVIGAAAIKYGSVLFPTITRPNIVEALTIIFLPVIIAVLLLINQSGDRE